MSLFFGKYRVLSNDYQFNNRINMSYLQFQTQVVKNGNYIL